MSEWKEYRLGELISTNKSSITETDDIEEIIYLDTGSVKNGKIEQYQVFTLIDAPMRAKRKVSNNNIIYSTVRPIQRHYAFIENPKKNLIVSTGFTVIDVNTNIAFPKYIYYFLISDEIVETLDMIAEASTSTYPSLKPNDIENLIIYLPPLSEQKVIAEVLSSLDDKIDLLHKQNETLETIAETLFRQWFIEEADESWEESTLDKIANYLNGLACQKFPPKHDYEKLPVLKIKELRNGFSGDCDWVSNDLPSEYTIQNGDVIFSWSGSLMIKIWDGDVCILNQHLFKVTSNKYPKWFYYLWTKHHLDSFISIAESKSTTMGHIKRGDLSSATVLIPSSIALEEMDKVISPMISKIINNNKKIKTLEVLRVSLLPKLMNGEILTLT